MRGHLDLRRSGRSAVRRAHEDPSARIRPALLPPSLPWLSDRHDHAVDAGRAKSADLDELLGDLDVVELLGEEALDERHAQALERARAPARRRRARCGGSGAARRRSRAGCVRGLSRIAKKKPALSSWIQRWTRSRISSSGQVLARQHEERQVRAAARTRRGLSRRSGVLPSPATSRSTPSVRCAWHELLRLDHAHRAEMVDHLARDAQAEALVGVAQQLDRRPPPRLVGRRRRAVGVPLPGACRAGAGT